jgi:hypothetical protein
MRRPSEPLPDFIEPEPAQPVQRVPEGDAWVHEIMLDGYRVAAWVERGKIHLLTCYANDWTVGFDRQTVDCEARIGRTFVSAWKPFELAAPTFYVGPAGVPHVAGLAAVPRSGSRQGAAVASWIGISAWSSTTRAADAYRM